MSWIDDLLTEDAIYWAPSTNVDRYGKEVFQSPIGIKCKSEDAEANVVGDDSTIISVTSRVFVPLELEVGGFLAFGVKSDSTPTNPHDAGASEIVHKTSVRGLDGDPQRTVFL